MSNEIRRTKTKLALMEQEGCNGLLIDAMKLTDSYSIDGIGDNEYYEDSIQELKRAYQQFLADNEKESLNQGTLDF